MKVFFAVFFVFSAALVHADPALTRLRQKHHHLHKAKVETLEDGSKAFGEGRLWKVQGINVLYLKGSRYEMAYQHGKLLAKEISDGSLYQASQITPNAIKNALGSGIKARILTRWADRNITGRMLQYALDHADKIDESYLAGAYGLSDATGIPTKTIINAALGPETSQVLLGITSKGEDGRPIGAGISCSSFVAWGDSTQSGGLVIGRNTDYPLNGYYDKHPTIIYFHPTGEKGLRFMSTTTAGFHSGGVVGLNEEGIYIAVHTVPTKSVSAEGMPVFMLGQEVLRLAHNLDEAVALLKRFRPAAGWNYVVTSVKERRTITVELSNDKTEVFENNETVQATTNHWRNPEMKGRFLHVNNTIDQDTLARLERMNQLLKENRGQLDAKIAMRILGDKIDPFTKRMQTLPNTIAVNTTVSSSVWLPEEGKMYLANGRAPTSLTNYVPFPTVDQFDPDTFQSFPNEVVDNSQSAYSLSKLAKAEQHYIEAKKRFEYHQDLNGALDLFQQATTLDSENPSVLNITAAVFAKSRRFHDALDALDQFSKIESKRHPRIVCTLYARQSPWPARSATGCLSRFRCRSAAPPVG